MTTPAPWITDRPPEHSDADSTDEVAVSTHIDNDNYCIMHWSRAAQGYLPWRHTFRWVPPKPEPPAPVIVTPEPEPEAAAPKTGNWITHRLPTEVDADKDGEVEFCILRRPNYKYCNYMNWRTLIEFEPILPWRHTEWWSSPTPMAAEPTPAAPEPEPEKATRGFAWLNRVEVNQSHDVLYAVATDGTAWWRFIGKGACSPDSEWIQERPLPQPGEE